MNEARTLADYDQLDAYVFDYWKNILPKEKDRISKIIEKLQEEGDEFAALFLKWATTTLTKRKYEEEKENFESVSSKVQPDLHHEGPLTVAFVQSLFDRITNAFNEMLFFVPKDSDPEWLVCKNNWINALREAGLYCAAILSKLKCNLYYEHDQKTIDIILCVIRDFEAAKHIGFEKNGRPE